MKEIITLDVNNQKYEVIVSHNDLLIDVLRKKLKLMGTKKGCGQGACGSCTVLVDGESLLSCLTLAITCTDKKIETIEGVEKEGEFHPIQQAFIDQGAVQCGYCTPGMILSAKSLLQKNPSPSREEIKRGLSGNLCRCTGYLKIIDAVEHAADHQE